jgi:hypothetical protein
MTSETAEGLTRSGLGAKRPTSSPGETDPLALARKRTLPMLPSKGGFRLQIPEIAVVLGFMGSPGMETKTPISDKE